MKNRLKVFRAEKNLTQGELAHNVEVTRQTIHAIEKGKYNPSLDLAFKIAKAFESKIEDIFHYEEQIKEIFEEIPEEHKRGYR